MLKYKLLFFTSLYLYFSIIHTRNIEKVDIYNICKKVLIISNNLIPKINAPKPRDLWVNVKIRQILKEVKGKIWIK